MPKPKKEYRKTEIVVRGNGNFPFDMLRYDNAAPASSEDASSIANIDEAFVYRDVKLNRFSYEGDKATEGRWRSFGWVVVSDTGI